MAFQGDQGKIKFLITINGVRLDINSVSSIEFAVGTVKKSYPTVVTYTAPTFFFPITAAESFNMIGAVPCQGRITFTNGDIASVSFGNFDVQKSLFGGINGTGIVSGSNSLRGNLPQKSAMRGNIEGVQIGTGGTSDYELLTNKPKINSVTLVGNLTLEELGIAATEDIPTATSDLENDSGFITSAEAPVQSVNGKTGVAVLNQDDVADGTTYKRTHNDFTDTYKGKITTNESNISTIEGKIPSAASTSNQLADKAWVEAKGYITEADIPVTDVTINGTSKLDGTVAKIVYETGLGSDSANAATVTAIRAFVNSSIEAVAAYYITADASGNAFATKAALDAGPWYYAGATRTPTRNDYAIVIADETHSGQTARYTYTSNQWAFQYTFNMSFTQAQINAINSGIDATKVGTYDAHVANTSNPHSVTKAQVGLGNVGNFKAVSTEASQGLNDTEKSNARANIGAGTSSFSGSYNDLSDKPTIPEIEDFTAAEINALWEAN